MTLREGNTGPEVGELQQLLVEAGYEIPPAELAASLFGPGTKLELRHFQASHVDRTGHALAEDGIAGDETAWALRNPQGGRGLVADGWRWEPNQVRPAVFPVLKAGLGELGAHEVPPHSNRGPRVDIYTRNTPESWCADFVSWCYERAPGGSPLGHRSSGYKIIEWAKESGRLLGPGTLPQPGDIWIIYRGSEYKTHVGLVAHAFPDGMRLATVEGNASDAVRQLLRSRTTIGAFVRPIPLE